MTTPNKDTDLKDYLIGKGTIEFIPFKQLDIPFIRLLDIPKKGTRIGDFPIHWHKINGSPQFNGECGIKCPVCEMLKPKTKWQRIKSWVKKKLKRK